MTLVVDANKNMYDLIADDSEIISLEKASKRAQNIKSLSSTATTIGGVPSMGANNSAGGTGGNTGGGTGGGSGGGTGGGGY